MPDTLEKLKAQLRPFVPEALLRLRRQRQFEADQARYRDRPLREVFEQIYDTRVWHAEMDGYSSGPGSLPDVSASYEAFVVDLILANPRIERLLDIGCGDFQVSQRILAELQRHGRRIDYVGCDIAGNVIAHNQAHHARPGVAFRQLDISCERPPPADIATVREVFQHLSNDVIARAIDNLRRSVPLAIVAECVHVRPSRPNADLVSGYRTRDGLESGVYIDLPPFSLRVIDEQVRELSATERMRTTVVDLAG